MAPPRKTRDDKLGLPDDFDLDAPEEGIPNEEDLSGRLQALRAKSPTGPGKREKPDHHEAKKELGDDLAARFAALRTARDASGYDLPVSPSRPIDRDELHALMDEARTEIDNTAKSVAELKEEHNHEELGDDEFEAILKEANELPTPEGSDREDETNIKSKEFGLPEIPQDPPVKPRDPISALSMLPAIPTGNYSRKPAPKQQRIYTDEEIDSWCVMCDKDGEVECLGCVGDIYCTSCWKIGHQGPDAGYEERRHKARALAGKGGGDSSDKRVLLGT